MSSKERASSTLFNNIFWVLKLNFKYVPLITIARIIGFLNQYGSGLLQSFIVGFVIDQIIKYLNDPKHDQIYIITSLIAFGIIYAIQGIAGAIRNYGENLVSFQMSYAVPEMMLYEKLNKLSTSTLENPEVQNKINIYKENKIYFSDTTRISLTILGLFISLSIAIIPLVVLIPIPTILLLLVSIPGLLINKTMIGKLWDLDKNTIVLNRRAGSIVNWLTSPETLKEIKLLNAYSYLKKYFEEFINIYFTNKRKIYNQWSSFDIFQSFLSTIVILFGIYQIILLSGDGVISAGQIAFFIAAITTVGNYIDSLAAYSADIGGTGKRLSEMRKLLDLPEEDNIGKEIIPLLKVPPLIELKNIFFHYSNSENNVIKNLNLKIKPGEKIAIVGENGAGKTTLVKLISNIYSVSDGEILINGKNLNNIDTNSWFQNIGVLYQDYNNYNDLTAFENIALGRINEEEIDYEKIKDAAIKADADSFIREYKNEYSQILSEKYEDGIRPSTGQWQKIAIARFFYRNAPILILDEPTASIDAIAEANIFDRIYKFIENKTVIIISHRFSTVRNADRIIVFDKGEIVEMGSHTELLEKNGKYAHAFRLQAKGYKE